MTNTNTDNSVVETIFKTQEGYNECDHCQSVLSPAAYFVKLMETVDKYIEQTNSKHSLEKRRPDLMEMKLNCDNTNKAELYLEIVNKVIEKKLKKDFGLNVLTELTTAKYPFNLPANIHLMGIRAYLKKYDISLADVYQELISTSDNTGAESLGLSPEEYKLITSSQTGELKLKELCGIPNDKSLNELKNVDQLNDYMSICYDRLQLILNKYEEEVTVSSSDIRVLLDAIGNDRLQLLLNVYSNAGSDLDKLKLLLSDIEQSKLQLFLEDYSRETGTNYSELKLLLGSYIKGSGIDNNALGKLIEDYNQNEENSDKKKNEKISLKQLLDTYENFKDWVLQSLLDSRKKDEKDHYELELLIKIYRRATSAVHSKLHKLLNNYKKGNGVTCDRLRLLINNIDNKKLKFISDFCKDKNCGALKDDANQDLKSTFDKFEEFTVNSLLNAYNKVKGLTNDRKLSISEKEIKNLSNESLCFLHRFIRLANKLDWSYDDLAQTLVVAGKQDIDEDVIKKIAQIKRLVERFENEKQLLNEILGFYSADIPGDAYDVITGLGNADQSVDEVKQFKKLLSLVLQACPDKEKLYKLLSDLDISEDEVVEDVLSPEDIRVVTSQNVAEDHLKKAYKIDSWKQIKDISKFAKNSGVEVNKLKSLANVYNDINGLEQISSMNKKVSRSNIATAIVDNEVIFFGGSENNKSSNKVDVYNVTTEKWEENEPLSNEIDTCTGKWKRYTHEARQNASVAIVDSKAIFFGGRVGISGTSDKIDIYDSKSKKWESNAGSASEARESAAVAVMHNNDGTASKAIFFGGRKENNTYSAKIDIYDATNGKWEKEVPNSSEARENVAVAVVGNKAIFFCGRNGILTSSKKVDIYDAVNGKWEVSSASETRENAAVAVVERKAIFFGGRTSLDSCSSAIDIYDAISEKWEENVPNCSEARENVAVAVIGNKAIFFGGRDSSGNYSTNIDVYNAATGKWTKDVYSASEARENAAVAVIGNRAIFFGGKKGPNQYSLKVDIYDNNTNEWKSFNIETQLKNVVAYIEEGIATFIGIDMSDNMQKYAFNDENIYSKNELNFSYRFIYLAKKLDWSLDELSNALIATGKREFNDDIVKEIVRIKNLQKRFEQPLSNILDLYSKAGELPNKGENLLNKLSNEIQELLKNDCDKLKSIINQDVKTHFKLSQDNDAICTSFINLMEGKEEVLQENMMFASFLYKIILLSKFTRISIENLVQLMLKLKVQKVDINTLELVANINDWFNEQGFSIRSFKEVLKLIEYKTILLSKLERVSIKELIQLMLSLGIEKVNAEKVEDTIKLKDWLEEYGFSIATFEEVKNYSSQVLEKSSEIKKLTKGDYVTNRKTFYQAIQKNEHTVVDEEVLDATYDFTEEYIDRTKDLESLGKVINRTEVTRVIVSDKLFFFGGIESNGQYSAEVNIYDVKKGQWEIFETSEARIAPIVTKVNNKIIFFCGRKGETEYSQQVDIYDSITGKWEKHRVSEGRVGVALAEVDNKVIFFCGYNGNHYSAKIDIYDSISGEWREDQACEVREDAKAAVINNEKAVFFSGRNFTDYRSGKSYHKFSGKIDIYDATQPDHKKRWSNCMAEAFAKILQRNFRGTELNVDSAVIGHQAIFFGSCKTSDNKYVSVKVVYDSQDGKVSDTSEDISIPYQNVSVNMVCNNEAIFFGTGESNNQYFSKAEIYNAASRKWEEKVNSASEFRKDASVAIIGNNQAVKKVIFFGGKKGDDTHSAKIEVYDAVNGKWENDFRASEARENAAVAVIGNKTIFFGGKNGTSTFSSKIDIYDVDSGQWKNDVHASEPRESMSVTIIGDKVIFFGGKKGENQYSSMVDVYDSYNGKWRSFNIDTPFSEIEIIIESNRANFIGKDSSNSIQKYVIGYPTIVDQFIENINAFTKVGLEEKDIKNITKYGNVFGVEKPWSISINQMQAILKYKQLEKRFASSTPNFSEYIGWLYSNKYEHNQIVEEISKLTKWNKETLKIIQSDEGFKTCFANDNNPIDSLLRIESIINMINESGIDVDLLLRLKNLHNINLVDDKDNKYEKVATILRSSITFDEDDRIIEALEEKKRDILVEFIISKHKGSNEITIKNTHDLYNFLLIDVEMSGCARISPLKAALNSMQLYVHRCILGLEEGVTVNQDQEKGLSEEMWNLLDNYREWKAAKKITLYPENYLNPTLRKSATAEYKALQNTLMQGDITDEAVAQAYIRYFEDFAQLVNLRIVDVYYADKRLHILGRTQAEPYTYYYRIADFKDNQAQNWLPWEKIDIQIPVGTARVIHAFGKVFIFWLQKTEKEKQVEEVSINDSILNAYYVFKKVDGDWSAQQKLPYDVKIDEKFEVEIRRCLDIRNWNKKALDEYKGKKDEKVGYLKHNVWDKDIEEAKDYFEKKVKDWDQKLKEKVKETKDINKNFDGKLKVILSNEKQEILVIANEKGFDNKRFALKKDLTLRHTGDIRYLANDITSDVKGAEQSIKDFYQKRKAEDKNVVDQQKKAIETKIGKEEKKKKEQEDALNKLKKEKESKEKSNKALQEKISTIENSINARKKKEEDLQKEIEELIKQLDSLQQQESIQDNLPRVIEKGKLKAAIDNFTQGLTASKKSVKNKKEVQEQLTKLETKATELAGKIDQLTSERTIEDLEKERGELEKSIDNYKKEIDKLSGQIEDDEKKIKELEEEIQGLQKQKEEIEKSNIEAAMQAKHKKLDEKMQKEIELVKKLIEQNDKDSQIGGNEYKDEVVSNLINDLYSKAYTERSEAILVPKEQHSTLNFNGFYGVYLWEIFFHIPALAAYLFNQEQKFAEARKWYQYILNPTKKGCDAWQFIPFKVKCNNKDSDEKYSSEKLISFPDPYKEADNKKVSFEKYVIISYVDSLIDWGDMLFSQNSWEGINQATILYIRAWDLLGSKPERKRKFSNEVKNICELSGNKYNVCKIEAVVPVSAKTNTKNGSGPAENALDITTYCNYFCTPENKDFIGLWERIEDRLYKIRHCLDIKGKRLELPLFQPPIDPRQLISAIGSGAIRISQITKVPHYRFKYMISYAKSIADTVTQIGSELLSVLEKKDAEALNLLYNKQEGIMANLMTTIKEKAIEALREEAKALNESLDSAKDRKSHYEKLIENGLSGLEKKAFDLAKEAIEKRRDSSIARGVAAGLHLVPTVFGFACGGFQPGSAAEIAAIIFESQAMQAEGEANEIGTYAHYKRREEDWDLQKIMATHDVEQIKYQISANKVSQANAEQDLKAHKESIKQIKEKEEFFRRKFTNQELYSWMKGELARLYFQTYKLALEIAKQAELAYRYEIDNDRTFVQPGHWNSLKQGLLAGQKLKFDLEQLDKEYHDANERRLEITKVISLKQLDPIALYELKTKGSCRFSFTEKLFDLDFPGHYARKIKDIKITIPAVVGPYENVHASLQQTSNQVILKNDGAINAIKYLLNPSEEEQPENSLLRVNWKQNQEIAISRADQDSGLFELSFGDDRYLPFEGTGAVSSWELNLPQATNRFDVSTISDVIIHLDYTALNGGKFLSDKVKNLEQLKYYYGNLAINISLLYPEEWNKFKQEKHSQLAFKPSIEIFPAYTKKPEIDLEKSYIYIIPKTLEDLTKAKADINGHKISLNELGKVRISNNSSLEIGSNWKLNIKNLDINKLEEVIVIIPYKAEINWK